MIPVLKSELRKLWTVRSTYYMFGIAFLISGLLLGLWAYGYKNAGNADKVHDALLSYLFMAVDIGGVFFSIVTALLVGHEYRHNTIMYSLTQTNRRIKFFAAKWIAALLFGVGFATCLVLLDFALVNLGWHWHGLHTLPQDVHLANYLWRSLVVVWAHATFAFVIAMLVRNLIGSLVIILIVPSTIENLLGLLLHSNTKYLPYTALGNLADISGTTSQSTALLVVCAYSMGGLLVAYLLFQKRDAN